MAKMSEEVRKARDKRCGQVPLGTHFAVVDVATGDVLHCDTGITGAATALEPGTCFGSGLTAAEAMTKAQMLAITLRGQTKERRAS